MSGRSCRARRPASQPAGSGRAGRTGRVLAGAALGTTILAFAGTVVSPQPAAWAGTASVPSAVGGVTAAPGPTDPGPPSVPVGPREVFVGDYETGDFSQWGQCQSKLHNTDCSRIGDGNRTMRIVSDPAEVRQGRYAARFNLRPGDVPEFGGGERSEVQSNAPGAVVEEGDERWYEWSMKFPADFENPTGGWFIVMQWHSAKGSPPLAINISNEGTVDIGGDGVKKRPTKTIGPVRRGEWVDYVMHVKFSKDSDTGFVEAWENGRQTVPMTKRATMVDESNYLKQGIYRDEGPPTSIVQDGLRVTGPLVDQRIVPNIPGLLD